MPRAIFEQDGALLFAGLMSHATDDLVAMTTTGPGRRLQAKGLESLIAPVTQTVASLIGPAARPVRAVLFDKSSETNWALGWHQDRTIVVRERRDTPGFGPWSRKQGLQHVAPPFEILAGMATIRIHLDPCDANNAPLKIALGSHLLGHVAARDAAVRAEECPQRICLAETGDVWAYATPILHASDRAAHPSRRRVLQVDYAALKLPGGLDWAGIEGPGH